MIIDTVMPYKTEPVELKAIPQEVSQSFTNACPGASAVRAEKLFGTEKIYYYFFRFNRDGRRQEALLNPDGQIIRVENANEQNPEN
jgi:hypothetical protein